MRRVWVIQCKSTGHFLTPNDYFTRSLKMAGRCYDPQTAFDTADLAISDGDYEIFSFWELDNDQD